MSCDEYRILWWDVVRYVDMFRSNPLINIEEPQYESAEYNAYFAGLVEFLTKEQKIDTPDWVYNKKYYLSYPIFPTNIKNTLFRVITAIETPLEFKSRNIFIGANTFDRC